MMLARKREPRACRAVSRTRHLVGLLVPALAVLLVNVSHVEAGKKCDSACRECQNSCASPKLDCLTHARADRTSQLGDCTPGRSGHPCRKVVRRTFIRTRSGY